MYEMCFADADAAVNEQRVITARRQFRNRLSSRMRQLIRGAYYIGFECKPRIKPAPRFFEDGLRWRYVGIERHAVRRRRGRSGECGRRIDRIANVTNWKVQILNRRLNFKCVFLPDPFFRCSVRYGDRKLVILEQGKSRSRD